MRISVLLMGAILSLLVPNAARGEQMLELFNCTWNQIIQKMPEIAEAGYDSLWVPNPAKGTSGGYSVGYDVYDMFDLGNINQAGSIPTMYGTTAQCLQMVQTAHRFGIRVYFDNVMNHRGGTVPGYNAQTPTNFYPGLVPQDFHLQTGPGGYFTNWTGITDYNNQWDVQNESLAGLVDLANEPGSINDNFGATLGSTTPKLTFVRQPFSPALYMNTNLPTIGGSWHPIDGHGQAVAEDVNAFLIRAVMWTLYTTKCDGFRLDAVKHVPSGFFGDNYPTFNGFVGGIQAMYDYTHGYGSNITGNGYIETDDMRNSCFNSESPRNDALLFGEHLGAPPSMSEYISAGMRLLNTPLHNVMNGNLGNSSAGLQGLDSAGYIPPSQYDSENSTTYYCFPVTQGVQYAQNQDASGGYSNHRDLQDAYYSLQQGIGVIYSDNYNQSTGPNYFPTVADANYLGEYGDNQMPELAYLHNNLARGSTTWSRWSDNDIVLFERADEREGTNTQPQNQDVVLFGMNDNYGYPGDISFDDGVSRTSDGYYGGMPVSNSRGVGIVVGFPPGTILTQLVKTSSGATRAYTNLLVHGATSSLSTAQSTATATLAQNRLIYVGGQTLANNGGAVELTIPSGGYVMYSYLPPEASRASLSDVITLRQGGTAANTLTIYRTDGTNGDAGFNPSYPFKMRGSVDQYGNTVGGTHVSNLTYAITIPVVTNGMFDIIARSDASTANTLIKLDGGVDINSQMGIGTLTGTDLRDHKPGYTNDVFMGYERSALQFQNGPEKFGARNILSNTVVAVGAETYSYTVGPATNLTVIAGSGYGQTITNAAVNWVFHDPTNTVTSQGTNPPTQMLPLNPSASQAVQLFIKVGYQFQANSCYVYYTTDGSTPAGSFGVGKGTTQTAQGSFYASDNVSGNIDWWKVVIPAQSSGVQVRYKVGLFYKNLSAPIAYSESSGSKYYGLTQYAITNFNAPAALIWLHNDLATNNTTNGLQEGYHILRARTFLPRSGQASIYNTFSQTFYYDASLPSGVVATPGADGSNITSASYTFAIRTDNTVTGVTYNISDSSANNDDVNTGVANGNGSSNGAPIFVSAQLASPSGTLNQQYPSLPQEFHFNYAAIPNSGTATITVHLNKLTTSVYTNRYTTLTRTINTLAPAQYLNVSAPMDGSTFYFTSNAHYTVQACYSAGLTSTNTGFFSVYLNGVLQPRTNGNGSSRYSIGGNSCGFGLNLMSYNLSGIPAGTNTIQVAFNNGTVSLNSSVQMIVINPNFNITSISGGASGQTIVWNSISNLNYQVWATTNLNFPFQPISSIVPGNGSSSFFFDTNPDPVSKFYQVVIVQ